MQKATLQGVISFGIGSELLENAPGHLKGLRKPWLWWEQ